MRLEVGGEKMQKYIFPFEKLDVWQLAVELADTVLGLLEKLPQNKHIRLISQMEAAIEVRRRCEQIDRKLNGLINSLRGGKGHYALK